MGEEEDKTNYNKRHGKNNYSIVFYAVFNSHPSQKIISKINFLIFYLECLRKLIMAYGALPKGFDPLPLPPKYPAKKRFWCKIGFHQSPKGSGWYSFRCIFCGKWVDIPRSDAYDGGGGGC